MPPPELLAALAQKKQGMQPPQDPNAMPPDMGGGAPPPDMGQPPMQGGGGMPPELMAAMGGGMPQQPMQQPMPQQSMPQQQGQSDYGQGHASMSGVPNDTGRMDMPYKPEMKPDHMDKMYAMITQLQKEVESLKQSGGKSTTKDKPKGKLAAVVMGMGMENGDMGEGEMSPEDIDGMIDHHASEHGRFMDMKNSQSGY